MTPEERTEKLNHLRWMADHLADQDHAKDLHWLLDEVTRLKQEESDAKVTSNDNIVRLERELLRWQHHSYWALNEITTLESENQRLKTAISQQAAPPATTQPQPEPQSPHPTTQP